MRRADVKEFLHEVLIDERFYNKTSPEMKEKGSYPKSEYSLILVIDAIIKYTILFDTEDLVDEYILQLRRFMKKCENYEDLVEGINRVIGKITAVILKIDLEEIETSENKKRILSYIYNRYITNGYVFHSIPGIYNNQVEENGLDPFDFNDNNEKLREIKNILEKHNGKNVITKDLKDTSYITITDSPAMAYHYALSSPYYLSELTATSLYMENEKKYDRSAYFRKDFKASEKNIEQLCRDLELSNNEATIILSYFVEEWKRLEVTTKEPTLVLIKRSSVNKNYLKDYRKILDTCDKEELSYSISRIIDSKIKDEKRYTPIAKENLKVITLPKYREIYYNSMDFIEQVEEEKEEIKEEMPERVNVRMEVVNAYGNASILALLGVLLIALGATITILLTIYKG